MKVITTLEKASRNPAHYHDKSSSRTANEQGEQRWTTAQVAAFPDAEVLAEDLVRVVGVLARRGRPPTTHMHVKTEFSQQTNTFCLLIRFGCLFTHAWKGHISHFWDRAQALDLSRA